MKREAYDIPISIGLLLLLIGYVLLVWPALNGPFLFDDKPNLQNLALFAGQAENLGAYIAEFSGNPGRPLAALSFLINDHAWPSDPFAFKYTNVLIHLLNGVLLFGLLRQLASACSALPKNAWWPLLAMAAWLLHPLLLSSQMLVVQRMTMLSGLFVLVGLWVYVAIVQHSRTWRGAFAALSCLAVCTVLAVLCKETGALLPLLALCLNITLLDNMLSEKDTASRRLLQLGCSIPALCLLAYILYVSTRPNSFANREFNMLERLFTQAHVMADYARQIVIPRLSGSGIFFDDYPISRSLFGQTSTAILALTHFSAIVLAFIYRRKFSLIAFGVLWFYAGHVLESTTMNLELYFEHRNYLPIIGPLVIISAAAFFAQRARKIGLVLLILWLCLLAAITGLQAQVWGSRALLSTLWAQERPFSLRASQEYINYQNDIGQYQNALNFIQRSELATSNVNLPLTALLSTCLNPEIRADGQEFSRVIHSIPKSPFTNSAMALVMHLRDAVQLGQCPSIIDEARWLQLTEAFLAHPKYRHVAGSFLHVQRAQYFRYKLNLNSTMLEFELAYALAPNIELSQEIARVLLSAGLIDEAEQWLNKGLLLKKPWIKEQLGVSRERSMEMLNAIKTYRVANRISISSKN